MIGDTTAKCFFGQTWYEVAAGSIVLLFFLAGVLNFSMMFFERHKGAHHLIRRWFGWRKISYAEYQSFLRTIAGSSDYSHKDGRLDNRKGYSETDWDAGCPAWDTFWRQNGDVIHYQQKPRLDTTLCFCRIRKSRRNIRVELMKEGWTEPYNGAAMWSYITNRPINFTGPSIMVRFRNSGTLTSSCQTPSV